MFAAKLLMSKSCNPKRWPAWDGALDSAQHTMVNVADLNLDTHSSCAVRINDNSFFLVGDYSDSGPSYGARSVIVDVSGETFTVNTWQSQAETFGGVMNQITLLTHPYYLHLWALGAFGTRRWVVMEDDGDGTHTRGSQYSGINSHDNNGQFSIADLNGTRVGMATRTDTQEIQYCQYQHTGSRVLANYAASTVKSQSSPAVEEGVGLCRIGARSDTVKVLCLWCQDSSAYKISGRVGSIDGNSVTGWGSAVQGSSTGSSADKIESVDKPMGPSEDRVLCHISDYAGGTGRYQLWTVSGTTPTLRQQSTGANITGSGGYHNCSGGRLYKLTDTECLHVYTKSGVGCRARIIVVGATSFSVKSEVSVGTNCCKGAIALLTACRVASTSQDYGQLIRV